MTFYEAKDLIIKHLTEPYGPGEAESIARIVLEDGFNFTPNLPDKNMQAAEVAQFEAILKALNTGAPVQYVMGQADFFGLTFKVNPAVLIPRQETEELVDQVWQHLRSLGAATPTLLDIGLGSGCIAITLKKKCPNLHVYGLELSEAALVVAKENASLILGASQAGVHFWQGNILDTNTWYRFPGLDVIVSNPPYIPSAEKHLVPPHVLDFEPWAALFVDQDDPLLFYRCIATFALEKLTPGGKLFFECNEFNAAQVFALLNERGFQAVTLSKDLAGADRMVSGTKL